MNHQEKQENNKHTEKHQKGTLGINGNDQQNQETQKDCIVSNHQERNPQESDKQSLQNLRNRGHGRGKRHGLRGVKRGDGEDNGGR